MGDLIESARKYCIEHHEGEFREFTNEPFSTHPIFVANLLKKYGYSDDVTQCIALLHDIIEDTEIISKDLKKKFGPEVASGVFILSKNTLFHSGEYIQNLLGKEFTDKELYLTRLCFAKRATRRVKIADMIHNTMDLKLQTKEQRNEKIQNAKKFYIPMGKIICPEMVKELEKNIFEYEKNY